VRLGDPPGALCALQNEAAVVGLVAREGAANWADGLFVTRKLGSPTWIATKRICRPDR
jgi:hypothetical protein